MADKCDREAASQRLMADQDHTDQADHDAIRLQMLPHPTSASQQNQMDQRIRAVQPTQTNPSQTSYSGQPNQSSPPVQGNQMNQTAHPLHPSPPLSSSPHQDHIHIDHVNIMPQPPEFDQAHPLESHATATTSTLMPPAITYDEVATAPSSPTEPMTMHDMRTLSASSQQLDGQRSASRSLTVTPSGSLLAVNKPIQLRESTLTVNYPDTGDDGEVCLMYARHEKIPMKDFAAEIRASMDVENFLNQAVLLLDLAENSVEAIMDHMLRRILEKNEPQVQVEDAVKACFTHDTVHKLAKTIQGTCITYGGGFDFDQSWICILCTMPSLQKRHVAIARLRTPANLGRTSQEVHFIILVAAPTKEKGTKNALETGRTFATLFADMDLRLRLLAARNEEDFKKLLWEHTKELAEEQSNPARKLSTDNGHFEVDPLEKKRCWFGSSLRRDFWRRFPHYISDYKDGILGHRTLHKTASTTVFLYFACLLPCIAFGMLNDSNTNGKIDVKKVIYSQTIGGLIFALIGGQPMTILLTTAPLALFTKVIYTICKDWDLDFYAMYSCVGLWNTTFLIIYALVDASRLMKWSTRSTEEIFALFIAIAFTVDGVTDAYKHFQANYNSPYCDVTEVVVSDIGNISSSTTGVAVQSMANMTLNLTTDGNSTFTNGTLPSSEIVDVVGHCLRENSLLFLLLMLGTLWLGCSIYNFTKTPYLNASKREILADYALPMSVLLMSFFGSYVFRGVKMEPFYYSAFSSVFGFAPLQKLTLTAVFGGMGLGFCLSLLFFMDQNISSAMVNSPTNKLKKGSAYSWDLVVIGLLNGALTFYGMPMVHGALPHSPLHVRAMADVEDYVEQGHVYQKIVQVRETRLTAIFAHVLIGLSLLLLPYPLAYIPRAVLDGLFLYLAVNSLGNNQMFERVLLLVTEQAAYPPNHYIRSVPQRKVHMFTFAQLSQLLVMCAFGFAPLPYLKMCFPILILLLLPIRHKLVPCIIESKYLDALDGGGS